MLIVLDGVSLAEVVAAEESALREAIIRICGRIVITDHILAEYSHDQAWSNLAPELARFWAEHPLKVQKANPAPVANHGVPRHHRRLVQDALGTQAGYLITHGQRLLDSAHWFRRQHQLIIVTPEEYMAKRVQVTS